MAAPLRTTRDRWVGAGLGLLAAGGPDAVRVEPLAAALGVTKGGFYGHFADRSAFLTALLDEWERRSGAAVVERVEARGGSPLERATLAGRLTFSDELIDVDLAVRAWARHDDDVAVRLRRVDNGRMDYLRSVFATFLTDPDDIEARSTLAFTLAVGSHFMAAEHGGRSRREAVELATSRVLFAPGG